ncbi:MAG: hypothetical protein WC565_03645 [Parcubacteria group bacterium]
MKWKIGILIVTFGVLLIIGLIFSLKHPISPATPTKTTISTATPVITDKPTQTPTLTPEPTLSSTPIPTETPVPTETPTTEVFIFKNGALWKEAFFVTPLNGAAKTVGFPSVLAGTELVAPIDGHVQTVLPLKGGCELVIISEREDWIANPSEFALVFAAKSWEKPVKVGAIKKGEVFAVVESGSEFEGYYKEKISLAISSDNEPSGVQTDPKEYLLALIQSVK